MPSRGDPALPPSASFVQDTKRLHPRKQSFSLPARLPLLDPSLNIPLTPGLDPRTRRPSSANSQQIDYLTIKQTLDDGSLPTIAPTNPATDVSSTLSTVTEVSLESSHLVSSQGLLLPPGTLHDSYLRTTLPSHNPSHINKYAPPLPTPLLESPVTLSSPPPVQLPGLGEFLSSVSARASQTSLYPSLEDVDHNYLPMPEYSSASSFVTSPQLLPINPQDEKLEDPPGLTLPPLLSSTEVTTATMASRAATGSMELSELTTLATELKKVEETKDKQGKPIQNELLADASASNNNSEAVSEHHSQSIGTTCEADDGSTQNLDVCTFDHRAQGHIKRTIKKRRICAAFRQIMHLGLNLPSTGLVTARDTVYPNCIWTNPVSIPFSELKPEDLILITVTGESVDETRMNANINHAAVTVHNAIYRERPDVECVVSGHPMNAVAFCAVTGKRGLDMLAKDFCIFYHNHAVYTRYGGVINDSSEASNIVTALGRNKALLMRNHGILTVGTSVESAIYWFTQLERYCQIQLLAESTGRKKRVIGDEDARRARKIIGNERVGWFNGDLVLGMIEKETGLKELS